MPCTLNLDFVKREIGDSPSVISEMLTIFHEVLTEFNISLVQSIDNSSYSELFIATHKIKPSLKIFGLNELVDQTILLEKSIKKEMDFSEIRIISDKIQTALPIIFDKIKKLLINYQD